MLVAIKENITIDLILKYFKVEKIYAFEPNEDLINKIDKSKYLNIEFIKKALGEKQESKKFLKATFHLLILFINLIQDQAILNLNKRL